MERMDADSNLMRWTEFFMSDRSVSLVIDDHFCQETPVETGLPQGSSVSLVLFPIYPSGVVKEMEQEVEGSMAISFADDFRWQVVADRVEQLCEQQERAGIRTVEWGKRGIMWHLATSRTR